MLDPDVGDDEVRRRAGRGSVAGWGLRLEASGVRGRGDPDSPRRRHRGEGTDQNSSSSAAAPRGQPWSPPPDARHHGSLSTKASSTAPAAGTAGTGVAACTSCTDTTWPSCHSSPELSHTAPRSIGGSFGHGRRTRTAARRPATSDHGQSAGCPGEPRRSAPADAPSGACPPSSLTWASRCLALLPRPRPRSANRWRRTPARERSPSRGPAAGRGPRRARRRRRCRVPGRAPERHGELVNSRPPDLQPPAYRLGRGASRTSAVRRPLMVVQALLADARSAPPRCYGATPGPPWASLRDPSAAGARPIHLAAELSLG